MLQPRVEARETSVLLPVVLRVLTKLSDRLREMGIFEIGVLLIVEAIAPVTVFILQLETAGLVGFLCE